MMKSMKIWNKGQKGRWSLTWVVQVSRGKISDVLEKYRRNNLLVTTAWHFQDSTSWTHQINNKISFPAIQMTWILNSRLFHEHKFPGIARQPSISRIWDVQACLTSLLNNKLCPWPEYWTMRITTCINVLESSHGSGKTSRRPWPGYGSTNISGYTNDTESLPVLSRMREW